MYLTPLQRKALWVLMGLIWCSCAVQWFQVWQEQYRYFADAGWEKRFFARADSLLKNPDPLPPPDGPPPVLSARSPSPQRQSRPSEPAPAFPIAINHASAAQLSALPGIGPSRAKAIVEYRNRHGPFRSPEGLLNIRGIGKKTLARIRGKISVAEKPAAN